MAVKVLSPMLGWNSNARLRFEREAQSAARIFHPNVAPVHRVGTLSDGVPYLTTEFIQGRSLAQRLKAEDLLERSNSVLYCAGACSGIHKISAVRRGQAKAFHFLNVGWSQPEIKCAAS